MPAELLGLGTIGPTSLALVAAAAFVGAVISGMSGVGGGIIVSIFIAPVVGVKAVVPTVSVAMLIAHVARVWVYRADIVWRPTLVVLATAVPASVLGSRVYVALDAETVAAVLGVFLLLSIPLRRAFARRAIRLGDKALAAVGAAFGFVAGTTIGGGILIIPGLLGAGLFGTALLGTDAAIGLTVLVAKTLTYGGYAVLTPELFVAGCLIGLCMVPGTYLAKWLMARTAVHLHTLAMEGLVAFAGVSFLWEAIRS